MYSRENYDYPRFLNGEYILCVYKWKVRERKREREKEMCIQLSNTNVLGTTLWCTNGSDSRSER